MGIVIRQSIWSSVIVYGGVLIGYINSLILLPYFLDVEDIGLIRLIQSNGMLLIPVAVFGMNGAYTKYFPEFARDPALKNKIFSFQLVLVTAALLLLTALIYLLRGTISQAFDQQPGDYTDYLYVSVIIFISQGYFHYLIYLLFSEKNATLPSFLNEVLIRVLSIGVLLLYAFGFLSFEQFMLWTGLSYIVVVLILVLFVKFKLGAEFDWKFYTLGKAWIQKLFYFGGYTLLIATSSSILLNISTQFTASYLGREATGILAISIFISTIIELPKRVVIQVVSPFIAKDFADGNMKSVNATYQRTSINLALVAVLLAIGILTNVQDLYRIIPQGDTFETGLILVILVVAAKVISMIFSVSAEILMYSKYFRLNLLFAVTSALLMIGLNIWLVPRYGFLGAGLAILLSSLYNQLTRFFTLNARFGFSPFTPKLFLLLGLGVAVFLLIWVIPFHFHPIVNIGLRSAVTSVIFLSLVYAFHISHEFNSLVDRGIGFLSFKRK